MFQLSTEIKAFSIKKEELQRKKNKRMHFFIVASRYGKEYSKIESKQSKTFYPI